MNTQTLNVPKSAGSGQTISLNESYFSRRNATDWVFAVVLALAGAVRGKPVRRRRYLGG